MNSSRAQLATQDQILSFRLWRHNLRERLPVEALLQAAGACGLQDSPPGTAALALLARLDDFTPEVLNRAVAVEKALLQVWSLRAAAYIIPTADASIFTLGVLPPNDAALRYFVRGAQAHLEAFQVTATDLVQFTNHALNEVLDGRELSKDELGIALARNLAQHIPPQHQALWNAPDGLGNNTYGETLSRFALSVSALHGLVCAPPRQGRAARYMLTRQWVGHPIRSTANDTPETGYMHDALELARRYLRCYGPSHSRDFAAWAGISLAQAASTWEHLQPELAPVRLKGTPERVKLWLLAQDLPGLESPPPAAGVRLLPPQDPYLLLRDRHILVPDRALQRRIWRTVGNPGAVLLEGRLAGLWRPEKRGDRLVLAIELLSPMAPNEKKELQAEAERMAAFRGCTIVEVQLTG